MSRRVLLSAALVAASAPLAACGQKKQSVDLTHIPEYVSITPPMAAASETITQTTGQAWHFNDPAPGRITLLYFGYTSCPDVCPTTMADLAAAMGKLDAAARDKVWVQFVSSDPTRDTAAQITAWLNQFDPDFHGGRAPIDQVIAAAQAYGIGIEAPKVTKGSYEVTHGASLLVLNPKGEAVGMFHDGAGAQSYQTGIPLLVSALT